jgi:hypothetical protein
MAPDMAPASRVSEIDQPLKDGAQDRIQKKKLRGFDQFFYRLL